jgi:hypothetical protein
MFFICASLLAVAMYWFAEKSEPDTGIIVAYEKFLQSYYVLSHIVLLPFYAFVTWALFRMSHYNYATILVLTMYTSSFMFLLPILHNSLNVLAPRLSTITGEVLLLTAYNTWTFVSFFNKLKY